MRMAASVMHTSLAGTGETVASSPNTLYLIPHVVPEVYEHLLCALHQEQWQKGLCMDGTIFPHTFISQGLLDSKTGAHSKERRPNSVFSPTGALRNRDLPLGEKESKRLEMLGIRSWSVRIHRSRVSGIGSEPRCSLFSCKDSVHRSTFLLEMMVMFKNYCAHTRIGNPP